MKLDELKMFVPGKHDLEGLLVLSATANALQTEYLSYGEAVPTWLAISRQNVAREVVSRIRDAKLRRLNDARTVLASLATPAERRDAVEKQIKDLERSLDLTPVESSDVKAAVPA